MAFLPCLAAADDAATNTARFLAPHEAVAAQPLSLGVAVADRLSRSAVRRFAFEARAGQFIAVRVAQVRGDVAAVLFDPAGRLVQLADEAPEGAVEVLDAVARERGRWTVQVAAFDWTTPEAAFAVTLARRERVGSSPAARARQLLDAWYDVDRPGVAVAVLAEGRERLRYTRGMANLEAGVPITARTRFDLGSVSKQFTAHAVAILVARGRLSLDEPVAAIVDSLPPCAAAVTVRHLLDHRSGLRELDAPMALAGAWYAEGIDNARVLDLLSRQSELAFAPGSQMAYSNTNYVLLAEIVARRSGLPFERFMAQEVFAPLGMRDAVVNTAPDTVLQSKANSYRGRLAPRLLSARNIAVNGSTSVNASLEDLVAWLHGRGSGRAGGAAALGVADTRSVLPDGSRSEYAFGQWHGERDGQAFVGHLGLVAGYRVSLRRFPDRGLAVAYVANDGADVTWRRARRIEDLFLGLPDPPPDVPTDQFAPAADPPAVDAEPLLGVYYADELLTTLEVVRDGAHGVALRHAIHGRIPLRPLPDADAFTTAQWFLPRLTPVRDGSRRVTGFEVAVDGGPALRFRRL